MDCFVCFKVRIDERRRARSLPNSSAATPMISSSGSTNNASRSGEQSATKEISKSSGFTGSSRGRSSFPALFEQRSNSLRDFHLRELRTATSDFSILLKIGEGGFGAVFKGFVKPPGGKGSPIVVAVKKLNPYGLQGHKEWMAEVQFLGVVEHNNLVKLIGYCSEDGERGIQRLLVYEFMPNRSLEDHLFNKAYPCLPWNTRLKIAFGAAEGLAYLHEGLGVELIYRDFKASNILLDEDFNPKLSDFGLAREGPLAGNTHVSTAVLGTYGYAAPEYVETGHLTSKCDVWSFGVVLLEILSGRRCMERNRPRNEQKLLDWVKACGKLSVVMDPRLENQYPMRGAKEVAELANNCLAKSPKDRPTMKQAAEALWHAMQFTEVGQTDMSMEEEIFSGGSEGSKSMGQFGTTESFRRRMLHLAGMKPGANALGMRKFSLIKAAAYPT